MGFQIEYCIVHIYIVPMVITTTRPLLQHYLTRLNVSPHMNKWWKGGVSVDGEITRHLSPYEQHIITPWLRTWPQRAYDKFMGSFLHVGMAACIVIGTTFWGDNADAAENFAHRS